MSASQSTPVLADFVADAALEHVLSRRRASGAPGWQAPEAVIEADEDRLQRRARRQALLLMIGSAAVSVGALYGAWSVLRIIV